MTERLCLVHYHEIGLKGKNRSTFENQLVNNLHRALKAYEVTNIGRISGYVVVEAADGFCSDAMAAAIRRVPGVARVSLAYKCGLDEKEYTAAAIRAMGEAGDFHSFKVHARRSATNYELHSLEMNQLVGAALCEAFPQKKVDVHTPDVTVVVHVIQGSTFVYAASAPGVGGLPVGTAGKVVTLLSSGFDSPVATWMVGRRGATCIPVHFSGRPQTSDASEWLCQDIVEALAPSGVVGRLYVVPFGDCQREISLAVPQSLRIIMYRRLMFEVAQEIARIEGAKALVTGESLGQVASQTLDNIWAVDEVAQIPVLRPLIGSDKQEIIKRAQEIGTYDISCQTAPDCCTLFMPRRPETHARLDQVHAAWETFDHDAMVKSLIENVEYKDFSQCASYHAPKGPLHVFHNELGPAHKPDAEPEAQLVFK